MSRVYEIEEQAGLTVIKKGLKVEKDMLNKESDVIKNSIDKLEVEEAKLNVNMNKMGSLNMKVLSTVAFIKERFHYTLLYVMLL